MISLPIFPPTKEENAMVERANKEVLRYQRAYIFDKSVKDEWSSTKVAKGLPFTEEIE